MIKTKQLQNQFRIVVDPIETVETVSLGVWVGAGSRNETPEQNGISHLLEHMAFKGTKKRSARQIAEEIENVGGYMNAYTSKDKTAYYVKVLKEHAVQTIDLLSDILKESTFAEEELKKEKEVIIQEINQSLDTPDDVIFDYFFKTAFPNQALGRPIAGEAEIVRKTSRETLRHYVQDHYAASKMVFSASGNIDEEKIQQHVKEAFQDWQEPEKKNKEKGLYKGGEYRKEKELEQIQMILGFEGLSYDDSDYYVALVLSTILGGGMSSRLFQEIREKRGLAYSTHASSIFYEDTGLLYIYAGTGEREVNKLLEILANELKKIQDTPVTQEELERGKAQLKSSLLMSLESTSSRCDRQASNMLKHGRIIEMEESIQKISAVSREEIERVARKIFSRAPTLATLGPIKTQISLNEVTKKLTQ